MPKISNITATQYETATEQAALAQELLEDPRWQFLRDYFNSTVNYAQETIWNDTITDVEESTSITDKIVRTFKRTKKSQVSELVGQYKLVKKFFQDMEFYVQLKRDLDEQVSIGTVKVDGKTTGKDINGPKTSQ